MNYRYKGARVDEPKKDKFDKRLKGPLGREQGKSPMGLAELVHKRANSIRINQILKVFGIKHWN